MPYLIDGEEVEVLASTEAGIIVRLVYEDEDGEPVPCDPFVVAQVFDTPPTERIDKRIVDRTEKLAALEAKLAELDREVRHRELARKRVKELANENAAFDRIEAFLSKRITHYLIMHYSDFEIAEAVDGGLLYREAYGRCDETKLLTLFGRSDGNLQWRVNTYPDPSGSWIDVEPFESKESALQRLQEIVNSFASETNNYRLEGMYTAAKKYGVTIPDGLRESVSRYRLGIAEGKVAEAQKVLNAAQAELEKARAEWATK